MKEGQAGNLLPDVLVSLVAGALGCTLVLMLTHGPGLSDISHLASVSAEDDLSAGAATDNSGEPSQSAASLLSISEETAATPAMLELQEALKASTEERSQLSATLVTLNRELSELRERVSRLDAPEDGSQAESGDEEVLQSGPTALEGPSSRDGFSADSSESQYEVLLAAGLDEQSARDLQSRNDQYQLSRLELFDQAAREGWEDDDQLSEGLEALQDSRPDLRVELGDSLYDRYLYEAGNSNRIAIDSVISGSAASQAGLQTGDLIISYAGESAFATQDLQQATRSGSRGESVQVVFERDGQLLSTDILRGPLGITLRPVRQEP